MIKQGRHLFHSETMACYGALPDIENHLLGVTSQEVGYQQAQYRKLADNTRPAYEQGRIRAFIDASQDHRKSADRLKERIEIALIQMRSVQRRMIARVSHQEIQHALATRSLTA